MFDFPFRESQLESTIFDFEATIQICSNLRQLVKLKLKLHSPIKACFPTLMVHVCISNIFKVNHLKSRLFQTKIRQAINFIYLSHKMA